MTQQSKQNTQIIAEIGVNHNGDINLAKILVDKAALAKVDYAKFQIFKSEQVICQTAEKAEYQKKETGTGESQLEMVKKLELSFAQHQELKIYCEDKGVKYLSTPFDLDSFAYLMELGLDTIKLPSGEITNYLLLNAVSDYEVDVILSTGMSTLEEIQAAIDLLNSKNKVKKITVLHCNTQYPTPYKDVNLNAMQSIAKDTQCEDGYSDHTLGIEVPVAAVAMGACMLEKHFTLSRELPGPDHAASIEPDELVQMVKQIRHIEQALGSSYKLVTESERTNINIARKFLVASRPIEKGEIWTEDMFSAKRTGKGGISPMQLPELLDKKSKFYYQKNSPLKLSELI